MIDCISALEELFNRLSGMDSTIEDGLQVAIFYLLSERRPNPGTDSSLQQYSPLARNLTGRSLHSDCFINTKREAFQKLHDDIQM